MDSMGNTNVNFADALTEATDYMCYVWNHERDEYLRKTILNVA